MCNICNQARNFEICWDCQHKLTQWRVYLYCRNVKCKKFSVMFSLHGVQLEDKFNDFWKQNKGVRVGKKKN